MEITSHQEIVWKYRFLLKEEKKNIDYKKMIVHWGMHHEDETSARAILLLLWIDIPVERKSDISPKELNDPTIIIADVWMIYDDNTSCYDHHQDGSLPASCTLILDDFMQDGEEKKLLSNVLFNDISHRDVYGVDSPEKNILSDVIFALNLSHQDWYKQAVEIYTHIIAELLDSYTLTWEMKQSRRKPKMNYKKYMIDCHE